FLLFAEQLDLLDVFHQQQFAAKKLYITAEFRVGKPFTRDRQKDAVHVAEVVDDQGTAANRGRQLRLHIVDLAAKFVPDLWDPVPVVAAADHDLDHRPSSRRFRFHTIDLSQGLTGPFDGVGDFQRNL